VIAIQVEDGEVAERLAAMGGAVRAALAETTQALADQLVAAAQARLPSGPLADSIAAELDADAPRATVGSDLTYAGVIEYGFAGIEQVRESLRLQSVAFGKPISPRAVLVRAHARTVAIPGRAYLSGALDEMQGDIQAAYADAVDSALAEGN
jgi:hypothetical protein